MARKTAASAAPTTAYIIDKIDAKACDVLRPVINEALKVALAPYGVTARIGKMRYSDTDVSTTLEVVTTSNDETQFKQLVQWHPELKADWFGKTFDENGETWRVVGANLGRSKNQVRVQRVSDGRAFSCTIDGLRAHFDKDAREAEQRKAFPINLELALTIDYDKDGYASLLPHATTLAVGTELPMKGGKILGLLKYPFEVKFKKNSLVVEKDGLGLYPLPKVIATLNALAKPKAA